MKKIIIASKNPIKIKSTLHSFEKVFPFETFRIESVDVPSGVSEQPMNNSETLLGAKNRVKNAFDKVVDADFWVGIEGGVEEHEKNLASFSWVFIRSKSKTGKARTGTYYLPGSVTKHIREGKELGTAIDLVFQKSNTKQQNGAVGFMTENIITRESLYEDAVVLALIPFKHPHY